MKTKEKEFDAVKFMRDQRTIINSKLSKMTPSQIVEYFKKKKLENGIRPSG